MKIATVLIYCSNEYRFLKSCLEEAKQFSDQIVVTVCDHFFDGSSENTQELQKTFAEFPDVSFVYFPYLINELPEKLVRKGGDNFYCNLSRFIGTSFVSPKMDYILFLDTDEIIEAKSFSSWIKQYPLQKFDAVKLSNYWYFREAKYRATTLEDSVVIAKREKVTKRVVFNIGDRNAIFQHIKGEKERHVKGIDGKAFVHHFSWVRTKEEMLKKVEAWGHRNERNWKELVEKEFMKPFTGKDFVHGYDFIEVKPYITIDDPNQKPSRQNNVSNHVITLSKKKLFQLLGIYKFKRWFGLIS